MSNKTTSWFKSIKDRLQSKKQRQYRRQYLVTQAWVYFGYNYSSPKEFISYMCEKAGHPENVNHFLAKFDKLYDTYGCYAIMNKFFVELSSDYQSALVDYAVNKYYPHAFAPSDKDKALLGI